MEDFKEEIKIAGIIEESIVDGPGIRFVIFMQGCTHNCKDCHNFNAQDFSGGKYFSTDYLIEKITENPLIDGVTLSGGEPFEQSKTVSKLAKRLKDLGYHIITYTGYTYEEINNKANSDSDFLELLESTDILIDGKFEIENRDLTLNFRGSRNQRIIDVKKSIKKRKIITIEL